MKALSLAVVAVVLVMLTFVSCAHALTRDQIRGNISLAWDRYQIELMRARTGQEKISHAEDTCFDAVIQAGTLPLVVRTYEDASGQNVWDAMTYALGMSQTGQNSGTLFFTSSHLELTTAGLLLLEAEAMLSDDFVMVDDIQSKVDDANGHVTVAAGWNDDGEPKARHAVEWATVAKERSDLLVAVMNEFIEQAISPAP